MLVQNHDDTSCTGVGCCSGLPDGASAVAVVSVLPVMRYAAGSEG